MNLRTIPRAAVGGYIKALRVPVGAAAKLLGRNGTTVDRVDATLRDVAGSALGDPELKGQAARRRTAADERDNAARLRAQAEQRSQEADAKFADRTNEAEAKRRQAEQRAQER